MKRRLIIRPVVALAALAVAALVACKDPQTQDPASDAAEAEPWAVTAWAQHFELFPEIDPLVAGQVAGAHVHVTVLKGFQAATEGSVTVVLTSPKGVEEHFNSIVAVRPGIFNVEILPATTGERQLHFLIEVDGVRETIPGGTVRVGTEDAPGGLVEPAHALPQVAGGETVDFLKEQQWRTGFATQWAQMGALRSSVTGPARVQPPSGGEVVLTAPVDGVVRASDWPFTGQSVAASTSLLSLIPTTSARSLAEIEASVQELQALADVATARCERLERLIEREAVSQRDVEEARARATGLGARLAAEKTNLAATEAGRRGSAGAASLAIAAPFAGRVAEVLVSPGEHVSAGATLVRVIRERPVWLRVALTPADVATLGDGIVGVVLNTGASAPRSEVPQDQLRLVAVAPEVDPGSGTVETLIAVDRSVDQLRPGLRATAEILLAGEIAGIVLPDSALIDDAGVPVMYVQLGGESFSRREVEVLHRQGELVMVNGVRPGERVVILGGAAIRRASLLASGPVEGHVH